MMHSQAKIRRRTTLAACLLVAAATLAAPAGAVIRLDSPTRNTDAPADAGMNTAWSLVGQIGDFAGTPIAPNLFIAAQHASSLGQPFNFDGHAYSTTSYTDIAGTDLRVFRIDTTGGGFSRYASLYDAGASGSEVGKPLFVAGRGTPRGSAYQVDGQTRGYYWTTADHVQSWGSAVAVDDVVTDNTYGDLVAFGFATSGLALTGGDSGGGLFVFADGQWKLAGVNFGIDGRWSRTEAGPYEDASIFDARGLWVGGPTDGNPANDPDHVLLPSDEAISGSSYASRISSNRAAINAIFLATGNAALVPEPATLALVGVAGLMMVRRTRRA